jgi:predicted nucleic acid-binding protein
VKIAFADTFYFLALISPEDEHHERVKAYAGTFRGAIVTTEWVLTEVANGLSGSRYRREAARLITTLPSLPNVKVIESDAALFQRAVQLYARRADKEWSLTDCISIIVMEDEELTDVLTRDHHFKQAGFTPVFADAP